MYSANVKKLTFSGVKKHPPLSCPRLNCGTNLGPGEGEDDWADSNHQLLRSSAKACAEVPWRDPS